MKKNIQILSLLMLMTSIDTQCITAIASTAGKNTDLLFALAYQNVNKLSQDIMLGNDDIVAASMLSKMNELIQNYASLQSSYNNAKQNSAVVGMDAILAENNRLKGDINDYNDSIKRLQAGGFGKTTNKGKIDDRRKARNDKQAQLDKNLATITANQGAMTQAQTTQAGIKVLMETNALSFEDLLESYIVNYGQYYTTAGNLWGKNTIISSIYSKDMPITPNQYNQLVATLNNAIAPFNNSITLEITPDKNVHASISDVLGYIQNLQPTAARTWTTFGIQAGLAAAITGAAAVAVAHYMGYSMADIANLFDDANAAAAGDQILTLWNNASASASSAANNAVNSIQAWFNIIPAQQQAAVIQTSISEMTADPAFAAAAAESLVANNQAIVDANPNDTAAQQALIDSENLAAEIEYQISNYGKPNFSALENSKIAPAAAAAGALLLAAKAGAIQAAQAELAANTLAKNTALNASKGFSAGTTSTEAWMQSQNTVANAAGASTPTGIAAVLENAGNSLTSGIAAALNAGKNSYSAARNYLTTPSNQSVAKLSQAQGEAYNNLASGTASASQGQYLVSNAQGAVAGSTPLAQTAQNAGLYAANTGAALGTAGAVSGATSAYDQYFS